MILDKYPVLQSMELTGYPLYLNSIQEEVPMLEHILNSGLVWQGQQESRNTAKVASGFTALDNLLGGGWPRYGLIEIEHTQAGIGEHTLALSYLREICTQAASCVWLSPPYQLHAPALIQSGLDPAQHLILTNPSTTDQLWAMEECLNSRSVRCLLIWNESLKQSQLRRLQVLCLRQQASCLLFRRSTSGEGPCELRLRLQGTTPLDGRHQRLHVQVRKQKGTWPGKEVSLDVRGLQESLLVTHWSH